MGSPTRRSSAAPERNRRSREGPQQRPRPSEAPPTGVLTGVLGEMAFYYGACWLHYRSEQQRPQERPPTW